MVQFVGRGEPVLHSHFPGMVVCALDSGLKMEVPSHLVRVSPQFWDVFWQSGVRLTTSYFSEKARARANYEVIW